MSRGRLRLAGGDRYLRTAILARESSHVRSTTGHKRLSLKVVPLPVGLLTRGEDLGGRIAQALSRRRSRDCDKKKTTYLMCGILALAEKVLPPKPPSASRAMPALSTERLLPSESQRPPARLVRRGAATTPAWLPTAFARRGAPAAAGRGTAGCDAAAGRRPAVSRWGGAAVAVTTPTRVPNLHRTTRPRIRHR